MTRVAVIGLGGMGLAVASRLRDAGFEVRVTNRTRDKAGPALDAGAVWAETPAEAVAGSDVVVISLADEEAVEEMVFGQLAGAVPAGTLLVDTSTVSPAYAQRAATRLAGHGIRRVEACVVGNPLQAREGDLRILAAGEPADVDEARPILAAIGHEVVHLGGPGSAATMKLVLNLLLAAQVASMAEALWLGERSGLDRDTMLSIITGTNGFCSRVMRFRAAFIRRRAYLPAAFRSRLMVKDMRLALDQARALDLDLPVVARIADRYADAVEAGFGDQDAAAIFELGIRHAARVDAGA